MAGPGGTEVGRASIRVLPDTSQFGKSLGAYIQRLERSLKVEIPTSVDMTGFRDDLAKLEVEAKAARPKVEVKVDVDRSILGEVENVGGRLAGLQRTAARAAESIGGVFDGIAEGASSALSGILPLVGKIPVIPAALLAAAPVAADLAVSLGPSLLAAVPAIVGAGAALGVMALSMDKLKGAFKPITDGFLGMRASIGDVLAKGVRPLTQEFTKTALPAIQTGLSRIARTMNGFLRDFLTWAGSAPTVKLIGQVLDGVNAAMKPLSGAAQAFADAILRIAKDAAPGLGILAGAVRDLAIRFDNFIKSKDKDGSLTKTISDSVQSALDLIRAIARLGRAIGGLFADIGKGSTSSFTDAINGIADAVQRFNDNGGGKQIHDFLAGVGQAIKDYFTSGQFQKTAEDLKTFAANARDLTTDLKGLVDSLKGAKGWLDSLTGSNLGQAFQGAINPLGQAIGIINGIKAAAPQAWDSIKSTTAASWASISATVSGWWAQIRSVVASAIGAVGAAIAGGWNSVRAATATAWAAVTSRVSGAWGAIRGAVAAGAANVRAAISAGLAALGGIASSAWARVQAAFTSGISGAIGLARSLPGKVVGVLGDLGSLLFNAGAKLIGGLADGIRSKIDAVTGAVSGIAQRIKDFFPGSPVKTGPLTAWNNGGPGKQLVGLLIKGLTGSNAQVAAAAANVSGTLQKAVDAYLGQRSTLAAKIQRDAQAVEVAQQRYAAALKRHGLSAAAAVLSARQALQRAVARLAGDKVDLGSLDKQFSKLADPLTVKRVTNVTKQYEGYLQNIATAREQVADRLKDAQGKLADAMKVRDDYAQSVRQATVDFANLTRAQAQEGQALTSTDIIANLRQKLAAINDFRQNINALRAQGLSNAALQQLVDAGVEAGGATAAALAQGGQAAVTEVNNLTAAIGAAATDLGVTTSRQFYQAGVNQAQAMVDGLQAQAAQLESLATQVAQQMVAAIKRVFAGTTYDYGFHPVNGKIPFATTGKTGGPAQVVVNVTNPVPETASESTTRILRRLAVFGPAALPAT